MEACSLSRYFCPSCFCPFDLNSDDENLSQYPEIEVRASSKYSGVIKDSIHLLKYNGKMQLADPLGYILFNTFVQYYSDKAVDFIVPIPLYYWRMFRRGFNQSFLLIRNFRKYWVKLKGYVPSWHIRPDILLRQRNTKSQTGFNRDERKENVKGAFAVRKKDILKNTVKDKNILLVDDVYTTGATTTEAGLTLIQAGASSVGIIVLARV